ncbi:class I adenylate-forming enzyme family protein [Streptomyces sp. NPDC056660]|uniref:class I adenylate-forming enzyme family protein n=1 Tax=Streptomyces sp. NPDC056660 TaxID=3345897 RepID=UPI0036B9CDB4
MSTGTWTLPDTLADAFEEAAREHGDREAYVEGPRRLTFAEWARAADGLAAVLADRGVRQGDVVALMLPSSIDYAICYGATALLGAVTTGLNIRLGPDETDSVITRCRPALVIRDTDLDLPPLPHGTPVLARRELARCYRHPGLGLRRPRGSATDPAAIIWTSGTTGVPKGAWFDHRGLAAALTTAGVLTARHDRRLTGTPFPHAGYMAKLWDQLATGSTIVVSPTPWRAFDMLRQLIDEDITVAGGVPTQWAKLLEVPGIACVRLPRLRLGVSATAPAPPELVERVGRLLGCPLIVRYAMTESPSITGTDPADPPEVQYRTVGRAQTGVEIAVRDEDGKPLPDGEVGRIHLKSPCMMRGYWNAPELTAAVLDSDGWLTTGDLGHITPDGNVTLAGRVGDLYIRGGYNVYPMEVEDVLADHPAVDRVAVVGVPAPVIGEIGVAFVVPADPGCPPTLDELRDLVRGRLADYKAPDRLEVVPELPLTPLLKTDKKVLRARAAGRS